MGNVLAVPTDASTTRGAVIDPFWSMVATETLRTPRESGPDKVTHAVPTLADRLARRHGPVATAGLVVSGRVDEGLGVIRRSPSIGRRDVRIAPMLRERVGAPVVLDCAVRASALAESMCGNGHEDFVFVRLGTGATAALVSTGPVIPTVAEWPGDIGHLPIGPNGRTCTCGSNRCPESYATAPAIARLHARASGKPATTGQVVARAARGDAIARRVWNDAVQAPADGIAATASILDNEVIVSGGGLAESGRSPFVPLHKRLDRRFPGKRAPTVVRSALGPSTAMLGAAIRARQSRKNTHVLSSESANASPRPVG
ncbi:ROK family protein (plasmid) [Embleya sp. NBC_00888]|uniref:ROK family protein n=1 Tax=Embleya sp. NBC_00888 TaxID=2975960 RepID=UPI002F912A47|nr:ROK family protein [Embleya sp. NBC_00888]